MNEIIDTWKSGPHQGLAVEGSVTPISEDKRDPLVKVLTEQAQTLIERNLWLEAQIEGLKTEVFRLRRAIEESTP